MPPPPKKKKTSKSYNFIRSSVSVVIFFFFSHSHDARFLYFFVLRSVMLSNDLSFLNTFTFVISRTQIFPLIETQKYFCQLLLKISTFKSNFMTNTLNIYIYIYIYIYVTGFFELQTMQSNKNSTIHYLVLHYLVFIGYRGSFSGGKEAEACSWPLASIQCRS